jgi:hypothetical protein
LFHPALTHLINTPTIISPPDPPDPYYYYMKVGSITDVFLLGPYTLFCLGTGLFYCKSVHYSCFPPPGSPWIPSFLTDCQQKKSRQKITKLEVLYEINTIFFPSMSPLINPLGHKIALV